MMHAQDGIVDEAHSINQDRSKIIHQRCHGTTRSREVLCIFDSLNCGWTQLDAIVLNWNLFQSRRTGVGFFRRQYYSFISSFTLLQRYPKRVCISLEMTSL